MSLWIMLFLIVAIIIIGTGIFRTMLLSFATLALIAFIYLALAVIIVSITK